MPMMKSQDRASSVFLFSFFYHLYILHSPACEDQAVKLRANHSKQSGISSGFRFKPTSPLYNYKSVLVLRLQYNDVIVSR